MVIDGRDSIDDGRRAADNHHVAVMYVCVLFPPLLIVCLRFKSVPRMMVVFIAFWLSLYAVMWLEVSKECT